MAVAHDGSPALLGSALGEVLDELIDLRFDGRLQHALGSLNQQLVQGISSQLSTGERQDVTLAHWVACLSVDGFVSQLPINQIRRPSSTRLRHQIQR